MTDLCLPWNKPEMRVSESDMIALKVDINGSSLFGQGGLWVSHRKTEESPNCLSLVTIFDNIRRLEWGEEPNYKIVENLIWTLGVQNRNILASNSAWNAVFDKL